MGNLDLKITIIFILSISTKQSKSQRMEISVITNQFRFLHSYQRYSVEMESQISQTTRIFTSPISTKQAKAQCMEISVITNQFRFLRSKSKIFRSKWEFWDYKSLDYIHHPYRPNERKRNAWRYLLHKQKIKPDFSTRNQRFLGRNGKLDFTNNQHIHTIHID